MTWEAVTLLTSKQKRECLRQLWFNSAREKAAHTRATTTRCLHDCTCTRNGPSCIHSHRSPAPSPVTLLLLNQLSDICLLQGFPEPGCKAQ